MMELLCSPVSVLRFRVSILYIIRKRCGAVEDEDGSPLQPKEMHTLLLTPPSLCYPPEASGGDDPGRQKLIQQQSHRTL